MRHPRSWAASLAAVLVLGGVARATPARVTFSAVVTPVEVHAVFEVTVTVEAPTAANCVTDVSVTGEFTREGETEPVRVEGFCDSKDGSRFRVRFSPRRAGEYAWRVTYRQGDFERVGLGSLTAVQGKRR